MTGTTLLTEKDLIARDFPHLELGYYQISEELSIDVEGIVRATEGCYELYVCQIITAEELDLFLQWHNR